MAGAPRSRDSPSTRAKTSEPHMKTSKKITNPSTPSHSHPTQSQTHSKSVVSRTPSGSPLISQRKSGPAATDVVATGGGECGGAALRVAVDEFDEEDVARYESHKTEEDIAKCRRTQEKIRALREKQDQLKQELQAAKSRLMIDKSRWSFECKTLICCVPPFWPRLLLCCFSPTLVHSLASLN